MLKLLSFVTILFTASSAQAFCGFYVARADASLYNKASQVVIARHEGKTVISMMNDFKGSLKEFAMVIPVPQVLSKGQINVGDKALFEHIDAFTAPRLVEYFDPDPCKVGMMGGKVRMRMAPKMEALTASEGAASAKSLGVKIEAEYTVGEYDIVILSAKQSDGLEKWLRQTGYKIPRGASKVLRPYIKQDMKFFVAKVNLKEQTKTGLTYLRPLQFAFESEKFMLPIRLGMINADGSQDLLIYVLTKEGRVETTNYRTVKLPTGMDIPVYVKDEFPKFYNDMFAEQTRKEHMKAVFTEYFWNMGWCDPCAADPLSPDELRQLGVFWLEKQYEQLNPVLRRRPRGNRMMPPIRRGPVPVMVTRLHVRYSAKTFPEDLFFKETKDRQNFQARYVLRHPWKGDPNECDNAKHYHRSLKERRENEAQSLARLTGWDINKIRKKIGVSGKPPVWWESLWK